MELMTPDRRLTEVKRRRQWRCSKVEMLKMDIEFPGRKRCKQVRRDEPAGTRATLEDAMLLLRSVARLIARLLRATHLAVLVNDGGLYRPVEALGYTVAPSVSVSQESGILKHLEKQGGPASVCFDDWESGFWAWNLSDHERVVLEDLCSDILAPVRVNGKMLAVVSLGPKQSGELYSKSELNLLQMLGSEEQWDRELAY
jgi:hypothetical protein